MQLKRVLILILIAVIAVVTATGCARKEPQGPLTRHEFLMDTVITLKIYDHGDKDILDEAVDRLIEIEDRMSKDIDTSDISLINKNAGLKPVKVHDDVYYVIERAKYFADLTKGVFDPTIGPLVEMWDIHGKDEGERESIPSEEEIKKNMELVGYRDLELLDDNQVYLKREGMILDLGAIAKGYAADEVKRIFMERGVRSAIIDLGGNLYALGGKDKEPWKIGVQDPTKATGSYFGIIELKDKSIVTSGDYERYFEYEGRRFHHIIDPETGYPSENEIRGVSIISEKSLDCDALSTALFILGVEEGAKLMETIDGVQEIFITKSGEVFINEDILNQFSLTNKELKMFKISS